MKRLEFNTFEEFACLVADIFDSIREAENDNDNNNVAIIAKYDEAKEIIKELLCIGFDLHGIEIHDADWNGYNAEFIISVCNIDGDDEIWCEPMLRENGYFNDESAVIYVLDNCSSKVLSHLDSENIYEVSIGDNDDRIDEEGSKCECKNHKCKDTSDKKVVPTSKSATTAPSTPTSTSTTPISKETFWVNGKECDKETYDKALSEFEDEYFNNVRDRLENYYDFLDEMKRWSRLFRW